jgi:hypothetical protein
MGSLPTCGTHTHVHISLTQSPSTCISIGSHQQRWLTLAFCSPQIALSLNSKMYSAHQYQQYQNVTGAMNSSHAVASPSHPHSAIGEAREYESHFDRLEEEYQNSLRERFCGRKWRLANFNQSHCYTPMESPVSGTSKRLGSPPHRQSRTGSVGSYTIGLLTMFISIAEELITRRDVRCAERARETMWAQAMEEQDIRAGEDIMQFLAQRRAQMGQDVAGISRAYRK